MIRLIFSKPENLGDVRRTMHDMRTRIPFLDDRFSQQLTTF